MVYYEPVKIIITTLGLVKDIINVVVCHYGLPNSIMSYRSSVFTSKFWSFLCYLLEIKRRLITALHSQIDSQSERQNNTIEAYLRVFVNYK